MIYHLVTTWTISRIKRLSCCFWIYSFEKLTGRLSLKKTQEYVIYHLVTSWTISRIKRLSCWVWIYSFKKLIGRFSATLNFHLLMLDTAYALTKEKRMYLHSRSAQLFKFYSNFIFSPTPSSTLPQMKKHLSRVELLFPRFFFTKAIYSEWRVSKKLAVKFKKKKVCCVLNASWLLSKIWC